MRLCVRKSDKAVFRPSVSPGYTKADAFVEAKKGIHAFYFVRVRPVRSVKRLCFLSWEDVPDEPAWEPDSGEFDVVDSETVTVISYTRGWIDAVFACGRVIKKFVTNASDILLAIAIAFVLLAILVSVIVLVSHFTPPTGS